MGALPRSKQGGSPSLGARMGTLLGTSGSDQNQTENTQKALEPKNRFKTNFPIRYKIKNATRKRESSKLILPVNLVFRHATVQHSIPLRISETSGKKGTLVTVTVY